MLFKSSSCISIVFLSAIGLPAAGAERVDFNRDIRPLLSDKCFHCHGPDEEARKAHLRFDIVDEKEGPFRIRGGSQAIKPGDLQASAVWDRLTTLDEDEVMPPKESHKKPLTDAPQPDAKATLDEQDPLGMPSDGLCSHLSCMAVPTLSSRLQHRARAPAVEAPSPARPSYGPHERWRHAPNIFKVWNSGIVQNTCLKHIWLESWGYNDIYSCNRPLARALLEEGVDDGASARRALERRGWDSARFAMAIREHDEAKKGRSPKDTGVAKERIYWPFP